uniref:Uncharacterized protein n=1 Tax=Rhizophora mucronata TaxID=61149 RepID=A0A2P2QJP9_RHIMU
MPLSILSISYITLCQLHHPVSFSLKATLTNKPSSS